MSQIVQQINFYQPVFRKQTIDFGIGAFLKTLVITVIALGLISGSMFWQQNNLKKVNNELSERKANLNDRLQQMKQSLPQGKKNLLLEEQLSKLAKQRDEERAVYSLLENELESLRVPMSSFFSGLARNRVEGLWLTSINIDSRDDHLALKGHVLEPELVPKMLSKLSGEEAFEGRAFQILKLTRSDEKPQMEFQLITMKEENDESS